MRQLFERSVFSFFPFGSRRAGGAIDSTEGGAVAGLNDSRWQDLVKTEAQLIADNTSHRMAARFVPEYAVTFAVLGILALYWQTAASIVAIWLRSETFAHGFVVVPICLWLVWRQRGALAGIPAVPWWPALGCVFVAGALWLVASAAGALGVKQFALVFMLQAAIFSVIGWRLARELLFPLAFLLFAVPAGEIFVPTLIDWTADFTVSALRWSGVPVYREANQFIIPSGAWSVVEACSGLRYIIASVMVGTIYAAVAYRTVGRRVAFLAASVLVPIVANWLRAYMIVMLAHLTNNMLAVGVDHIIYGWVFFGIVMVLLFWVGSFWQETKPAAPARLAVRSNAGSVRAPRSEARRLFTAAVAAIIIAGLWRPIESVVARPVYTEIPVLQSIAGVNGWLPASATFAGWKPHYVGYSSELDQTFVKDGHSVGLYIAYFRNQEKGRELVTSGNVLASQEDWKWKQLATVADVVDWVDRATSVHRAEIGGPNMRLEVFRFYWVNGTMTSSDYVAKVLTAWSKLRGRGDDSALVVIYARQDAVGQGRAEVLRDFARAMSPSIEHTLQNARGALQ